MKMLKDILRIRKINECETLEESNKQVIGFINDDIEQVNKVMARLKTIMLSDLARENQDLRDEMLDAQSELASVRHGLKTLADNMRRN